MVTSLVQIGDFHAAPGPRNEARYRALDQLIAEALQLPNLGAWLWPGDLSHQRQAIADELALITRAKRMADRAPLVIVRGNHDVDGDLDKLAFIGATYPIYVVNTPRVLRIPLATGQFASIACLPYPHRAGLVLAGVANPDVVGAAADALDVIFMEFTAQLEKACDRGDLMLFIGHANIGGAVTSTGQPNIGREIELSPRHLDRLGPIYKGLNHIHKAQEIYGAHYAGSICRLDWGEIEEKSYIVVEIPADPDLLGLETVTRYPLNVAPMYYVEAQLTRDGFTWACTAGPGGELQEPPASWKGCEVRVRCRYNASECPVLDKAKLLAEFAEASLLQFDPIAEKDHALRAPEVAAARTLPEKITAWSAIAGTVASEGVLQKLALLEHESPEAVVAATKCAAEFIASGQADDEKATVAA
jgi:hypothetical protein